ncbi:MAG: tetratricopeptide repeat protein, partial [Candidatus Hydrogenedentes bacterium]|nr:tetratricopeptide repeat protein [Candidatus Hydrogenedentota bacterium]
VEALVEGSVFWAGNDVRITAQLIHAATDSHLLSENYSGTLENIFQLQGEVAMAIAEAIRITVTPEEETRITTAKPVDPEAYEAYLRGRFYFWKLTQDGLEKAAESFQHAVELAPGFAEAHAWLGMAHWAPTLFGFVLPAPAISRARPALDRALALDDTIAVAHILAGHIALNFDRDWPRAEREFLRAIELNPSDPQGHFGLNQFYYSVGRFDDGLRVIQKAIDLDPLDMTYSNNLALGDLLAGRYEEAIAQQQKVIELEPALGPYFWRNSAIFFRVISRYDEAIEVTERGIEIYGRLPMLLGNLLWAQAAAGRKAEAEALLTELHDLDRNQYVRAGLFAEAYAALGDMDEAYRWIDRAIEDQEYWLTYPFWPGWFLFQGDPRFLEVLRRIGYPEIEAFKARFQPSAAAVPDTIDSLAVLPFDNLMGDPEQEYFVDGMTDALSTELGKISALTVKSRTSTMQYKDRTTKTMPQIARELGADVLVEGSVFRDGNAVRISARLVDGLRDEQIWAESYDGTLTNILALQKEVAMAIAKAIRVALTPGEETRIASAKPVDPEAYDAYLRGKFFYWKFSADGFPKAVESFQRALALDPDFAEAHAWLGMAHGAPSLMGEVPAPPGIARARPEIDKALALDDTLSVPHVLAGYIALVFDWDWARAEREFLRAVELNAGDSPGHAGLSQIYERLGRFDEALRETQIAIDLDPLNSVYSQDLANVYVSAGRYQEAIAQRQKVFELDPTLLTALRNASIEFRLVSRYDDAVEVMERGIDIHGRSPRSLAYLLLAYADAGRLADAEALLAELNARARDEYVGAVPFALAHAALGDMDEAFRWLGQAVEDRENPVGNPYWPLWFPFRDDPRFLDMLRRINYPAIEEFKAAMQNAPSAAATQNPVD